MPCRLHVSTCTAGQRWVLRSASGRTSQNALVLFYKNSKHPKLTKVVLAQVYVHVVKKPVHMSRSRPLDLTAHTGKRFTFYSIVSSCIMHIHVKRFNVLRFTDNLVVCCLLVVGCWLLYVVAPFLLWIAGSVRVRWHVANTLLVTSSQSASLPGLCMSVPA